MLKQFLNSGIVKYRDSSVSRANQLIELVATYKTRYFAKPRRITVSNFFLSFFVQFRLTHFSPQSVVAIHTVFPCW